MTATAYHLGKVLAKNKYDLALNIGIAGAFNQNLALGGVVNVVSDCFADSGAEDDEKFLSMFDLGLQESDAFPFVNGKLHGTKRYESLPSAKGITVNTVHGNEEHIRKTKMLYAPDVESMEGAAFLYACLSENLPCSQIRAISNYVEKRNKAAWNIPLAVANLHSTVITLLS